MNMLGVDEAIATIEDAIKTALPNNSLIIFQVEEHKVADLAKKLQLLDQFFGRHNITTFTCPKDIKITIVPRGTNPDAVLLN